MTDNNTQEQLNTINSKLDLLMDYVVEERLKRKEMEDLIADLSIVGKDVYHSAVDELDKRNCDFESEKLKNIMFKLMRNIDQIDQITDFVFQMSDLMKEIAPIGNEMILDFSRKLDEFEKKGYFEYLKIWMEAFENVSAAVASVDMDEEIDNKSLFKLFKELNSPEVRKSLSYMLRVVKKIN